MTAVAAPCGICDASPDAPIHTLCASIGEPCHHREWHHLWTATTRETTERRAFARRLVDEMRREPWTSAASYIEVRSSACHAGSDGDCAWEMCPQIRDGEPVATGRHCPLDAIPVSPVRVQSSPER